jgi:hypothetical protein
MKRLAPLLAALLLFAGSFASAHEVPDVVRVSVFFKPEPGRMVILVRMPANAFIDFLFPAFADSGLDLTQAEVIATDAANVWIADQLWLTENGAPMQKPRLLRSRISRLNDPFFGTFDDAVAHVNGAPLPPDAYVTQDTAAVDALLEAPIASTTSTFAFEPKFGRLGVLVYSTLTFLPPDGAPRLFRYEGDPATFTLNPSRRETLARFTRAGAGYMLAEPASLLFVLCIALAFRRPRPLAIFLTTFVCAQALAVVVALELRIAPGWLPVLSSLLVAAMTAYMGIEAIIAIDGPRLGAAVAGGLVLGTAVWSLSLQPIAQFGGAHALAAAGGFVAGVVGLELVALGVSMIALQILLRLSRAPRAAIVIVAALAIHVAWQQMLDRADALAITPPPLPAATPVTAVVTIGIAAIIGTTIYLQWQHQRRSTPLNGHM